MDTALRVGLKLPSGGRALREATKNTSCHALHDLEYARALPIQLLCNPYPKSFVYGGVGLRLRTNQFALVTETLQCWGQSVTMGLSAVGARLIPRWRRLAALRAQRCSSAGTRRSRHTLSVNKENAQDVPCLLERDGDTPRPLSIDYARLLLTRHDQSQTSLPFLPLPMLCPAGNDGVPENCHTEQFIG